VWYNRGESPGDSEMAGIPVSSVKNFPSIEEHFDLAFVSTGTVAGFTTLPQAANGYTDLGVCLPEEATIVGAWIAPEPGIALPATTAGLALVVSGGWDWLGRIFPGLAGVRCGTHEEGFAGLLAAAVGVVSK